MVWIWTRDEPESVTAIARQLPIRHGLTLPDVAAALQRALSLLTAEAEAPLDRAC